MAATHPASSDGLSGATLTWSQSLPDQPDLLRKELAERGYAVVRSMFTTDEIERLRAIVRGHLQRKGSRFSLGKTQPNAAVLVPDLHFIFSHPRVVSLFKAAIGADRTAFTGHCDIHMNMLSGWHRDSGEAYGGYFSGDYFGDESCRVFKMAIYLQDATEHDGLFVIPASHRDRQHGLDQAAQAKTMLGDVVIFDVRLLHRGQLPDLVEKCIKVVNVALKGRSRTVEDSVAATYLKGVYWKLINRRDRLSVFFTYGEDNNRTREFADANMVRQDEQAHSSTRTLPEELLASLARLGVTALPATSIAALGPASRGATCNSDG